MKIGDVVISTAGHDMGELFIVQETLGEYAFLIDGKNKPFEKPKKKKNKHIVRVGTVCEELAKRLNSEKAVLDADIRKQIKVFRNQIKENVCQKKM